MRTLLKLVCLLAFGTAMHAQIPLPPINLTGAIGCQGFPCLNNGTLNLTADANRTLTAQETSALYMKVTSSVTLTATRNLIYPAGRFPVGIENATPGGQALNVCGPSGACVTIPNSTTTYTPVWNDGANFVSGSSGGGGSGGTVTTASVVPANGFAGTVANPTTTPAFTLSTSITGPLKGTGTALSAAGFADIVGLFGSGTCSGYLKSDGTCGSTSGGGSPGGALYNVQLFGVGPTFSGSANITADVNSNLHVTGSYYGTRLNFADTSGTCGGAAVCNPWTTNVGQTVTANANEVDQIIGFSPTFYGPGRDIGPVSGSDAGTSGSQGWASVLNFNRRGIHQANTSVVRSNAIGDFGLGYNYVYPAPGCGVELSAEACTVSTTQALSYQPATGTYQTGGTNTLPNISHTGGASVAFDGGYLYDTQSSTQTIATAFAGTASVGARNEWSIPLTASSVPVSTGICTTSASLPDSHLPRTGQVSNTIAITCSLGSLSTGYAYIVPVVGSPSGMPETVQITAGGSTSVTLNHSFFHGAGAVIYQGGVANHIISVDSDLTAFGNPSTYIALGSTDGTHVDYCGLAFGSCSMQLPRVGETPELTTSAIHIDPFAEVTSNTGTGWGFTVEPNPWIGTSAFAVNDAVIVGAPFFAGGTQYWKIDNTNLPYNQALGGGRGFVFEYGGAAASAAYQPFLIMNDNANTKYSGFGGYMSLPLAAVKTLGPAVNQISLDAPFTLAQVAAGGAIYLTDPSLSSTYYAYDWMHAQTGDAFFDEINNDSITHNGLITGQRRLDIASLNVRLGLDASIGPSGTAPFEVSYGIRRETSTYSKFINTSQNSVDPALDVTNPNANIPVAHFHNSSNNAFIVDNPVQFTGLSSITAVNCLGIDSSHNVGPTTCGSGSSGISGQAAGVIPLGSTATTIGAQSHIDDGVTTAATITSTEPIVIAGSTHGLTLAAGTAVSGAAGKVVYAVDASSGFAEVNENNTGLSRVCTAANGICSSSGVADTTTTVGTTAVSANSCSTAVTVTMTGLATSMTAQFTPTTDVSAVTGWGPVTPGLYISAWPSATNTLSYKVCNSSGSSITPGSSVVFNVSAR